MGLTETAIKNLGIRDKAYKVSDGQGLFLEVSAAGSKLWRWAYVFPGDYESTETMNANAILECLYDLGFKGRMTGHGFRGIASTILHEQGYPHEHIELQLAHTEKDAVSRAYNYAKYLEPRAKMMQEWADYIAGLTQPGNAV